MKRKWLTYGIGLLMASRIASAAPAGTPSPSEIFPEEVELPDVEISVSRTGQKPTGSQSQTTVIDPRLLSETQALTPKELSDLVPNVYMPDYGSAMTGSIYIRGLGSRINEPVMAMVVDGVPLMDKNMYDHAMQDVVRIEMLRGPQASLYGRNSPAGVMEIRTIRPLDLTTQLTRAEITYGSANTVHAAASYYRPHTDRFGFGFAAHYRRTDGFYTNLYDGSRVDHGQQAGGRLVFEGRPSGLWRITGGVYADWLKQGAFPYASALTDSICYNHPAGYGRMVVIPSLRAEYKADGYRLDITAAYQFLRDRMEMDQDYTAADIFTLTQAQRQHNATLDVLLQNRDLALPKVDGHYQWQVGVSGFAKHNTMAAPVTFMREGIDRIILANANAGIRRVFPDDSIAIRNNTIPIADDFTLFNAGGAIYHQSHFRFGGWHLNAGVRIDYEFASMDYDSRAEVDYRFTMMMSDYAPVQTRVAGRKEAHYIQILPRLALSYEAEKWSVYGYAAKGYKAGGYNPQIFSTITQNRMMDDLAADMGVHLTGISDPRYSDVAVTAYKPEKDWTFEIGGHWRPAEGLTLDADLFHIQCYDQQVTVFPNGKTTGRMMANAARSRIWGAETAAQYRWQKGDWSGIADIHYGWTDARFIEFNDGIGDYAGNHIPYAPLHTLRGLCSVQYRVGKPWLQAVRVGIRGNMTGPIYWNEQNDCRQGLYALLNAHISFEWRYIQVQLWGKNLTNTRYDVFYFRSMGNDFLQHGRPVELGVSVKGDI